MADALCFSPALVLGDDVSLDSAVLLDSEAAHSGEKRGQVSRRDRRMYVVFKLTGIASLRASEIKSVDGGRCQGRRAQVLQISLDLFGLLAAESLLIGGSLEFATAWSQYGPWKHQHRKRTTHLTAASRQYGCARATWATARAATKTMDLENIL